MSSSEFKFLVDPAESDEEREARWDKELGQLQSTGYTVSGVGPDGDWPIRNDPPEGKSWTEFWQDPTQPFVEVYNTVPLGDA